MVSFSKYLKDYLEFHNISQTEFAMRLGISQKHMNELLNGKAQITSEMAANIERLTGISASFILKIENSKRIEEKILEEYGSEENAKRDIMKQYCVNELKKRDWLIFKDETNIFQIAIDILDFLVIKDFSVMKQLENQMLFKKSGTDFNKLALWIARCDEISKEQEVNEYNRYNFNFLVQDLKKEALKDGIDLEGIKKLLNTYGIYFVCEKALLGTKVRGVFKVRGKQPAIYVTENYAGKDSLYYEIFHELGHCKSDYNEAKNKVIVEATEVQEKRADEFALKTMISKEEWDLIIEANLCEKELLKISKEKQIPMCFIVGRLAKEKKISYQDKLYQKYFKM